MEDYLSEKEQWEWLKSWVRSNGLWIVGGVALGIAILLGMRWWDARQDRVALDAGAKYHEILQALDRGDKTRAQTLTTDLERDHATSPYADQARLIVARQAVEAGELDKAAGTLKTVMEKTEDEQLALVGADRPAGCRSFDLVAAGFSTCGAAARSSGRVLSSGRPEPIDRSGRAPAGRR